MASVWLTFADARKSLSLSRYMFAKLISASNIIVRQVGKVSYVSIEDLRLYCEEQGFEKPRELRSKAVAFGYNLNKFDVLQIEQILNRRAIKLIVFSDYGELMIRIGEQRPRWIIVKGAIPFKTSISKFSKTVSWLEGEEAVDQKGLWRRIRC